MDIAQCKSLRRAQAWLSGAVTAGLLATLALVNAAARSECVNDWIDEGRQMYWRRDNSLYVHKRCFVDLGSRIQLQDIPEADYSRGGVHFFGTSKLASLLKTWELPAELRPLINNFAMGGLLPVHQDHLIRYLVENEGLLEAGPERVMVVLGLFWGDAEDPESGGLPFVNAWTRYGAYSYDCVHGLQRTSRCPVRHWLQTRQGVGTNFLHALSESVALDGDWRLRVRPLFRANRERGPDFYRDKMKAAMGPDWRRNMDAQIDALRATTRYLRERGVEVQLLLLPDHSWFGELPYRAAFETLARQLGEQENVPVHDMTNLLPDEEFADHAHVNHAGAQKGHAALMDLALRFLDRTGALGP